MYSYLLKEYKHTLILPKPKYIMIHIRRLKWWGGGWPEGGGDKDRLRDREAEAAVVFVCEHG